MGEEVQVEIPEQGLLASGWEQAVTVRQLLRQDGCLLRWPTVKLTGVPSKRALNLNEQVILIVIREWAQVCPVAKPPPVQWLKQEACYTFSKII